MCVTSSKIHDSGQEKAKLAAQVTAQDSVIDGLKAERKLWGEELAHQGRITQQFMLTPNSTIYGRICIAANDTAV